MVSTLEQMQVPNGTGPGVRRIKRSLLASRTRCNVLWKPPKFGIKVNIGIKVQFGNKLNNCITNKCILSLFENYTIDICIFMASPLCLAVGPWSTQ